MDARGQAQVKSGAHVPHAVVVGAGVSGCACAATLAEAGIRVTLVNPALDRTGEPCFGSLLTEPGVGVQRALDILASLPAGLGGAWSSSASVAGEGSFMIIDRRLVSIETKRALEQMPGLEFRQGLVNGLGVAKRGPSQSDSGWGPVWVRTAFGEELVADAVVVAVGLGLGGTATVGGVESGGGRYGELSSEGLMLDLQELGAELATRRAEVGPRFAGGGRASGVELAGSLAAAIERGDGEPRRELVSVLLERVSERAGGWLVEDPPSPYSVEELWPQSAVALISREGAQLPVLVPDGLATGEAAALAGSEVAWVGHELQDRHGQGRLMSSRARCVVEGLCAVNLCAGGRLESGSDVERPVWITGRAGGAKEYLGSLAAGVRTGKAVAQFLGCVDAGLG